jgi:hypothetical protein
MNLESEMAKREQSLYRIHTDADSGDVVVYARQSPAEPEVEYRRFNIADRQLAHNRVNAELNGWKQKLADVGALQAGANGKVDPVAKRDAVLARTDALANGGPWNQAREGGMGQDAGILISAFMLAYPDKPRDNIVAHVKGLDAAHRRGLLDVSNPKNRLAPYVNRVRAEMAEGIEAEDLDAAMDIPDEEAGE